MEKTLEFLLHQVEAVINVGVKHTPALERFMLDMLDAAFAPKQILRQLGMIAFLQVFILLWNALHKAVRDAAMMLTETGRKESQLHQWLGQASTYSQWKEIASMLDEIKGHDEWRKIDNSSLYDHQALRKRIKSTYAMIQRGDVFDLMFRLRGGLSRDQFGVLHDGLYSRAMAGTKLIVEKYHETMSAALNLICDSPISDEEIPTDARLAFFNETRHAFGRTALLLSGGAYLGYYHLGVVKALFQEGMLPRVISGASAGSIMTAITGTRTDVELAELFLDREDPPDSIRTDFFHFSNELKSEIARRLNYLVPHGLRWMTFPLLSSIFEKKILNLDTEHFKKAMMQNIGLYTFQEAFDRTGRVINVTVAPLNEYDPPRLLNYLTAPHVCVWSAAAASCAIPGVFDSVSLIVKEPNGQYRPENEWARQTLTDKEEARQAKLEGFSDGSIESDLPMQQLSELFNVNHFIVSQVNPHSAILSAWGAMKATVWSNPIYSAMVGYLRFLTAQCRDWLKNIIGLLVFRSKAPLWSTRRGMAQALTQEYEGRSGVDVTIMPWVGHISFFTALTIAIKNPNKGELKEVLDVAEANTWPHLARIRGHCLIEMTLDKCVQRLRKRITDESERQRALAVKAHQSHPEGRPGVGLDRTPSFYTSRSIVNLSGLSVADPLPFSQQARRKSGTGVGFGHLILSTSQTKLVDPVHHSETIDTPRSSGTTQERQHPRPAASTAESSANSSFTSRANSSFHSSGGGSFLNLSVPAGEMPLNMSPVQELNTDTPISDESDPSSLTEEDLRVVAAEGLKEEVFKTTNMASFYYKKTTSGTHIAEEN